MLSSKERANYEEENSLPSSFTTPNLLLNSLATENKESIVKFIEQNVGQLERWYPWIIKKAESSDPEAILNMFLKEAEEGKSHHFSVYSNDTFIGMISLCNLKGDETSASLVYWLDKSIDKFFDKLFIEALRALSQLAFYKLSILKLVVPCVAGNFFGEVMAKEMRFKLKRIDLISNKSVKIYELDGFEFFSFNKF
ncbi:MAG: hypothetical protein K0R73_942 [Candidatus Midichloriaceae bacterium]|jgi:hypothetical protein|nr:hypothetical protein [Candidatus Midichloriaceae bacterium]